MDAQRALLDELMGTARDLTEEERKAHKEVKWDDPDVCRSFMARFCPHDLFVNTKSNLGPCAKIHDSKLKESFESSPRHDSYMRRFEAELAQQCEKLVVDLDRKIRRGRERLAQDIAVPPTILEKTSEQLLIIEEKVKKLLVQIEELGEAGKVAEAEALMRKVELLNAEKTAVTNQADNKVAMLPQEKKMELCEICGSFLVSDDVLERTQSHVTGKQHIGYGLVRDFLAEHKAAKEKAREEERIAREKKAEEHRKQREKEYDIGGRDSGTNKREKSGERDYDRDRYYDRNRGIERPHRGSEYRGNSYRNGRDSERDRHRYRSDDLRKDRGRMRSRSRSPSKHGYGRSRSPDQ
ncbi:hypothetical protein GUJ93_ZPchr0013g37982 [Zizania palustris]|uniref:Uncharacterized protein n=1 Tax=Zizania palustris TaxID=103762 RepID=A0A8J5X1A1_ZIZPA|nr:hypothetical protein GUJ93_ZPchr0013g37982 [Zizania palustris]